MFYSRQQTRFTVTLYCMVSVTLRSSSSDLLIVPHHVKTVTAPRAFRVAKPTIWNNLPDFVKVADSSNRRLCLAAHKQRIAAP